MVVSVDKLSEYEKLWICYTSGQMNYVQLQAHCKDDTGFKAFVDSRTS